MFSANRAIDEPEKTTETGSSVRQRVMWNLQTLTIESQKSLAAKGWRGMCESRWKLAKPLEWLPAAYTDIVGSVGWGFSPDEIEYLLKVTGSRKVLLLEYLDSTRRHRKTSHIGIKNAASRREDQLDASKFFYRVREKRIYLRISTSWSREKPNARKSIHHWAICGKNISCRLVSALQMTSDEHAHSYSECAIKWNDSSFLYPQLRNISHSICHWVLIRSRKSFVSIESGTNFSPTVNPYAYGSFEVKKE